VNDEVELNEHGSHANPVTIHVNNKPVTVPAPKVTGLQIKEAAVAQGVIPDTGFQLSLEHGEGAAEHIRDDQRIVVHERSRFIALAPDDNS
jgi:hypothetical protein